MFRRLITLVAAAALVAALAAPALAERVKVRVEGKTTTIFGSTQPTLTSGPNALAALEAASLVGEFYYHVNPGPFVNQIGRFPGVGFSGWSYKVNGVSPPIAADQAPVKDGDTVLWYWTTFSEQGSTPTLLLRRRGKTNCYSVVSQNDQGTATPAERRAQRGRPSRQDPLRRGLRRPAPRPGAGDRSERRALERAEVKRGFLVAFALVLLTGCGGERAGSGSASLWVTRDRGATVLLVRTVPAGLTAMQALDRELDIDTSYGGRFVQSIDGVEGDVSKQRDWFWFLNGIEADRSAADYRLRPGDVEWWDFRSWEDEMREPVVVGAFPEPSCTATTGRRDRPSCATSRGWRKAPARSDAC